MVETTTYASQALFLIVAVYVGWSTLRSPRRSNLFALAFFILLTLIIGFTWVQAVLEIAPGRSGSVFQTVLVLLLPYVLLRLAGEYTSVDTATQRLAEIGFVFVVVLEIYPGSDSIPVLFILLFYFVSVSTLAARRFTIAARSANGITRMRLRALSIASVLLGTALASVAITAIVNGLAGDIVAVIRQLLLIGSALLYFAGFSPPVMLRRAWHEPELRRFLHQTRRVPSGSAFEPELRHLETITAQTLGAPNAAIGLWNNETGLIEFPLVSVKPGETIGGRAFAERRPILSLDTLKDDPESREVYELGDAYAVMAAPMFIEEEIAGVIALYTPNPPVFAEDDLSLLSLLADQIGILLENRKHVQAQAELAALEESNRLKDEFLSAAAHDLKTPLTTILATGQYLERRLRQNQPESSDLQSVERLNREAERLRRLVEGLLDASRIEQGQLVLELEQVDLAGVVTELVERLRGYGTHTIDDDVPEELSVECDSIRIQQVLENITENARKYSPPGSTITIKASSDEQAATIDVSDQGIGISEDEHQKIFARYYRSENAVYRTSQGIGLGLYICHAIVEQHNGAISVVSNPGEGSTFRIMLPRHAAERADEQDTAPLAIEPVLPEHDPQ